MYFYAKAYQALKKAGKGMGDPETAWTELHPLRSSILMIFFEKLA